MWSKERSEKWGKLKALYGHFRLELEGIEGNVADRTRIQAWKGSRKLKGISKDVW